VISDLALHFPCLAIRHQSSGIIDHSSGFGRQLLVRSLVACAVVHYMIPLFILEMTPSSPPRELMPLLIHRALVFMMEMIFRYFDNDDAV